MKKDTPPAKEALVPLCDPIADSMDQLMSVAFTKSNSSNYHLAVSVARGAFKYGEGTLGNQPVHVVIFSKTPDDAKRAVSLLNFAHGWKGLQIFLKGRPLRQYWDLLQVLECYITATACNDYKAHCVRILDDPFNPIKQSYGMTLTISLEPKKKKTKTIALDQYSFPCAYLLPKFKFLKSHPSTPNDQVQAAAVENNCDICPYFDHTAFTKIGTRLVTLDEYEP